MSQQRILRVVVLSTCSDLNLWPFVPFEGTSTMNRIGQIYQTVILRCVSSFTAYIHALRTHIEDSGVCRPMFFFLHRPVMYCLVSGEDSIYQTGFLQSQVDSNANLSRTHRYCGLQPSNLETSESVDIINATTNHSLNL